jgi:L-threonylcarbamoyladenylate synthase
MIVSIERAVDLLNSNEVVALPTETVYGLAARIDRKSALEKVFVTKQRPSFDPLIVHISAREQLAPLVKNISPAENYLMESFWPGPLTIVLPKTNAIDNIITAGLPGVAVRMPQNPLFLKVIDQTSPLAAPSANLFGHTSPTRAEHVLEEFSDAVSVLDGGPCSVGIESTVVAVEENNLNITISILRPGMISKKQLEGAFQAFDSDKIIKVQSAKSGASPGHLEDHYQPSIPLVVAHKNTPWSKEIHQSICRYFDISEKSGMTPINFHSTPPALVARTLYSQMRSVDQSISKYIFLEVDDVFFSPEWAAIYDRVQKASTISLTVNENGILFEKKIPPHFFSSGL